ncbi:MAG: pitrilysin family protein [Candidatus Poribacteria bacterium]|nr:pitrilysin family protein [Candidatus Poribacteria bacterium]
MRPARALGLLTLFVLGSLPGARALQLAQPERFRLENGLTVILVENHQEPTVAVETFYRAGFFHEPLGKANLSHMVEHLMVRSATASYAANEAFNTFQQNAGMMNAETLASVAHYDYIVPKELLETTLKVESERLSSIRFAPEVLAQEVPKAAQEIDFVQNSPQAGLIKFGLMGLNQTARYGASSVSIYESPTTFSVEDVEAFYRRHYRADSATLIIVGDFDSAQVKSLVTQYFADIPRRTASTLSPMVMMRREIDAMWDLKSDAVYLVFPGEGTLEERIALTMFGNYLNGVMYMNSALTSSTKSVFCSNQLYPVVDAPFFVFAEALPGGSVEAARAQLEKTVRNVALTFDEHTFTQLKLGFLNFLSSSAFQMGAGMPNITHDMLLGQEAINLGVKELLRDGKSPEEFRALLDGLDFKTANGAIQKRLSPENEKVVIFRAVKSD